MNSILSFFYEWRDEVLASNQEVNIATQVGEKYVIAEKSCHNFVSLNYGIIGYAREIFSVNPTLKYIPVLHCNQDSIESFLV